MTTPAPGTRLTPNPHVRMGITGISNPRPAQPDDYGRVDFDDITGDTHAIAYAAADSDRTTMHITPGVSALDIVVHDGNDQVAITVSVRNNGVTVTDHQPEPDPTTISVTLTANVTDNDVDEIMETAADFIDYWTELSERGNGTWVVYDDNTEITITRADIRSALQTAMSATYRKAGVSSYVHNDIEAAMQAAALDVGEIDATAADQLVQVAAFGRVTHG